MPSTYSSVSLCLVSLFALSACTSNDDNTPLASTINWESCEDHVILECATVEVPVDYQAPDGETMEIALRRRPADNVASTRMLLVNPGGPGASGITLLNDSVDAGYFPERIRENFNIVGFDPRGVGKSRALDCTEFYTFGTSLYPTTEQDIRNLIDDNTSAANDCIAKHGDYLKHLGTANVARDMDEIRKAANVDKINFLGYSYGTRLGAVYLQNFPQSSGAFVLDGVLSPSSSISKAAGDLVNFKQSNLDQFFQRCAVGDNPCDPAQLSQQLQQRVDLFIMAIDSGTLPAEFESFESLQGEAVALLSVLQAITTDPDVAEVAFDPLLAYLQTNDSQILNQFSSQQSDPGTDNEDPMPEQVIDPINVATRLAVYCGDDADRPTVESLTALQQSLNSSSDLFAETGMAQAGLCAGWPEADEPLAPIMTSTAPQSLLIGGTFDSQTLIEWLDPMAQAIGGIAMTSDHRGHTVVFDRGNSCVDDQVVEFLLNETTPVNLSC